MTLLLFIVALALSVVAAWYSIAGLMVLFAAATIPVAVMASTLEVAKLVTASWLYNNWIRVPFVLKSYLSFSVVVLMFVTSLGIFGFLSKAHLDQAIPAGDIITKLELIDEKMKIQTSTIESSRIVLKQMDEAVNQALGRGVGRVVSPNATEAQQQQAAANAERNTNQAANLRRTQVKERDTQQIIINKAQETIQKLREEKAPITAQARILEAEVGPIKYVAEMIWGVEAKDHFDSAVRFLIITLIFVFDPLAVLLIIAANMNLKWNRGEKAKRVVLSTEYKHTPVESKPEVVISNPVEAVAKSEPRPFKEPVKSPEMIWPTSKIHEMASNIKLNLAKSQITQVDKAAIEHIIEETRPLPDDELKKILISTDEETLKQVYARIVDENREEGPGRRQGTGGPPGTPRIVRRPQS